ncbi:MULTISPECIES: hypothetical protein [Bacteria]|uniref:hypothetical protein n=1 Tax=Bacteria TaxID=2 RepID=UPI003C7E91F4
MSEIYDEGLLPPHVHRQRAGREGAPAEEEGRETADPPEEAGGSASTGPANEDDTEGGARPTESEPAEGHGGSAGSEADDDSGAAGVHSRAHGDGGLLEPPD